MRRRGLLALLPLELLPRPAGAQGTTQETTQGITWLDTLMQRLAAIPARQADFIEEKRIAALSQPLVSRGRLVYRRPDHLEQITTAPQPESVIVDGDRLSIAGAGGAPKLVSLDSQPAIAGLVDGVRAALAGDLPGLQRFYRIEARGRLDAWQLILTPAGPPLARMLRGVILDGENTNIRSITIEQANGDTQIMTMSEARP